MSKRPTAPAVAARRRAGPGLPALALILFFVAAGILLGGLWFAQDAADQERTASQQRQAGMMAQLAARQLGAAVEGEQRRLAALARHPELIDALGAGDRNWLAESGLAVAFPGAARLRLFPRGWDEADPGGDPPIGYALLGMLREAEDARESPVVEAHLLGRPQAHVNFLQPVVADGEVLGTLVVSYPVDWVSRVLPLPAQGLGRLIVSQAPADDEGARVVVLGGEAAAAAEDIQAVPGTVWRLRYQVPAAPRVFDPLSDPWFLTIVGVSLVLLALLVWGVMTMVRGRVVADAREWAAVAREASAGQVSATHSMRLPESDRVLRESLPGLGKSGDGGTESGGASGARAPRRKPGDDGSPPRPARYNDPDDLLSGLEVEENVAPEEIEQFRREGRQSDRAAPVAASKESHVTVEASLFRAYDIRGVVGRGLSADVVRMIGRAIGSEAASRECPQVVVGRDGRLSSPELADALAQGLRDTGREVIDIGRVPTPVTYFATYHLGTGSGVEVTGSHNPPDYNGLKIMLGGETLYGQAIADLHRRIVDNDLIEGDGSVRQHDVLGAYIDRIAADVTLHRPLKVVVDCGNGVAGETAPLVLRSLGCEVVELFCEIDGEFPNHHPDPSVPDNLKTLIDTVREQDADVGLAFDGDGDRLGVVDAEGKIIWPDRQLMLFAMDILSRQPGADIIFDVKCSAHLARLITDHAGVPVMWRTGHSLIKAKLKESGAPLAGEMSGHIFFNDRWDGFDDGIYAAARLLEILSLDPRSSTEVFAELPETVSTPEIKVNLEEGEPPRVISDLVARAQFPDARITTIDGLRVDFLDGWGLVRASNTTPCLVLRFEADTVEALERIKEAFRQLIAEVRPDLRPDF